jgi:hypothetical protein
VRAVAGSVRVGPAGGRMSLWGTALACACVGHCVATALLAGTVLAMGGGLLAGLPVALTAGAGGAMAMWIVRRRGRSAAEPSQGR